MPEDRPLSRLLLARLPHQADDPELEPTLATLLDQARKAWPTIAMDEPAFLEDLAARTPAGSQLSQAVRTVHAADLYLAGACRRGAPRALEAFERGVLAGVRAVLLARRLSAPAVEEVLQQLRARLFVGDGEVPGKIAEYTGRGPLAAWVRMAAVRTSQNLDRGRRNQAEPLEPSQLAAPAAPPELGYIKARYRGDFKAAFEEAFASLGARERTLLRLNLLDGLSTAKLAKIYRADASTVRRWLADARQHLQDGTRARLAERIGASEGELESMMGLLITQLEESVRRILGGRPHLTPRPSPASGEG